MKHGFLNDYSEVAPSFMLQALSRLSSQQLDAYGQDVHSLQAKAKIRELLDKNFNGEIYFVTTGTMANIISISAILKPYEAVVTVHTGHIVSQEAGAIEATGHKVIALNSESGKLTPELLNEFGVRC